MILKNKTNKEPSLFSNIFYFIRILFKISPLLVIGEALWGIMLRLPTRLVSVIGVKYVIDNAGTDGGAKNIVTAIIVIALVLLISELLCWLFREFYWNMEKEKVNQGLSSMLYNKAKDMDLEAYDDPNFYNNFILAVESSSGNLNNMLNLIRQFMGEVVSLITICSLILAIDPWCLVIILITVAVFTPISTKIGNLQLERRVENNRLHRRADYFARVFYLQDYAKEVRMNRIKPLLIKRYNEAADDVIDCQRKYVKKIDILYFIQETGVQIVGFMLVLPLYLGWCALEAKTISSGDFVAAFNGAWAIAASFSFLTVHISRNFSEQSKIIYKVREFLGRENKLADGDDVAEISAPEKIELKNVSFTYPNNTEPTLKNINLTLNPYEKIALVGYNGAGKTTLTNLLLRLYDATEGEILIGGKDIKSVTLKSHRNRFAAVFQDFQLFAASLAENVALDTEYEEREIQQALFHSGFDKPLKNGVQTEVLREFDDSGMMFSGGEAQKITVARAFYKNCPYVIMDEPSANLDPVAEYNLNKSMTEVAKDKTVIFISHRLSTTRHADKIYVMEHGEIVESGNHDELMKQGGKYAYMFNLQAEKYRNE